MKSKAAWVLAFLLTGFCLCARAENTNAEDYLDQGNDFLSAHQFDQAIINFSKALEINPNLAKAYDNRGVAYAEEGSFTRAIDDFTMAIANDPQDAMAYNNRGHAYEAKGNLLQAVDDYTHAVNTDPLYVKAYKNRAQVFYKLQKMDQAWADVFKVEELGGSIDHDFYQQLRKAAGPSK